MSRLAFDIAVGERDMLRATVERQAEQIVRMKRVELGMREVPKPPAPESLQKRVLPPPEVLRLIQGRFHSKAMEDAYLEQALDLHRAGAPWPQVAEVLVEQLGEPPSFT